MLKMFFSYYIRRIWGVGLPRPAVYSLHDSETAGSARVFDYAGTSRLRTTIHAAARGVRQQDLRPGLDFENITLPCARLPSYLLSPR